jgi:hypothetical protein
MNLREKRMTARFHLNMDRIHSLVKLIHSDIAVLKPTGFGQSEGPRAEIQRAVVVFLHATFEDVLRSWARPYSKKFTFYSGADIDKILRRCQLDASAFKHLYPPLTQMAKRRTRIVHYADLSEHTETVAEAWTIADDWQLIMWLLAVPAFHSLLAAIDHNDDVAQATYRRLKDAMDGFVIFGKQLGALAHTSPELQIKALQKAFETLDSVSATLLGCK